MERVSFPTLSINARSLDVPSSGANRLPFRGVLTRIDEPSDSAPHGSNGKRVLITMDAARNALDSLLGMAVNYGFDDHKPQEKVGVIFGSEIIGNELHINGVIYAADFPEVAGQIQANKDKLGFSFEARELFTNDASADPVRIVDLSFTGAAILLKDKAAYKHTAIFAKDDSEMSVIDKMSAVERAKLANSIEAAAPHMNESEIKDLLRTLTAALGNEGIRATKADERRVTVLNNLMAARQNAKGTMQHIDGALRRAAMPPFEEIALKPPHEIKNVLASAKKTMSDYDYIVVKDALWRLAIEA
jgi:hypothetical protein